MTERADDHMRVLMYSHDTFGLGHLRRTRAIAHALVEQHKHLSVLIISGSSIAGAFDFKARVDFIKIPSVIKLHNGDYQSLSDHIDVSDTLSMRRDIIASAARSFAPDIMIVDKEPRGLRGELDPTLPLLRAMGCEVILGLREVLDEPEVVRREWEANDAASWVSEYYDRIWIYGSRDFFNPISAVPLASHSQAACEHVGFLARSLPKTPVASHVKLPKEYILVTAGGGGDGGDLMAAVLAAREHNRSNVHPLVLVLGPFMSVREKSEIRHRAARLTNIHVLDFDSRMETIMAKATAVVSMGGYNTFCELMSFDKRALIVPRTTPRREQLIRARRAADFGLVDILDPDEAKNPWVMAKALADLTKRKRPSQTPYALDLTGLNRIGDEVAAIVRTKRAKARLHAIA